MKITSNDPFQPGYTYTLTCQEGEQFDPEFTPELTPRQMLELGVFGGAYFEGHIDEYPKEWFAQAKLSPTPDASLNYFEEVASQPLQIWQAKGWIYDEDPRGWFQWYCRYYAGRRLPAEDARQIKRWKAIRRHIGQIRAHCTPGDQLCRRRQRQAVLHWAYDSRKI